MKKIVFCTSALLITAFGFAQIDNNSGFGTPINAQESTNTFNSTLSTNKTQGLSNNTSFLNVKEDKNPLDNDKPKNLDMTTDNGLLTNKFDYKPSWLTKDKEALEKYGRDQNLGTYGTKSRTIEILCRDNQYVDGDKVRIIVNDQVIIHQVNLRADFQSFEIDLKPGMNHIQFQALNQGTSGPNTAHFRVYDKDGNMLTESQWDLLTGNKGNLVIVQEP